MFGKLSVWPILVDSFKKRPAFNKVFHNYDVNRVALFSSKEMADALQNPLIIRHRLKLEATVNNAKAVQRIQEDYGSFSDFLWGFVDYHPIDNLVNKDHPAPAQTNLSIALAKALKNMVLNFLGRQLSILLCRLQEWSMIMRRTVLISRFLINNGFSFVIKTPNFDRMIGVFLIK